MSSVATTSSISNLALASTPSSLLRERLESSLGERLSSTLLLRQRADPLTVPIGVAALDELTGGLPRGALTEIAGPASSGRTGVMLTTLAEATRRHEVCALIDASNSFDPASAATAGIDLQRLLWVRCNHRAGIRPSPPKSRREPEFARNPGFAFSDVLEQVLKVTDLLLQSGGFGMVVLDLGDVPVESARRVPLTSWFRFRRAVEPTPTVLLLIEQEACARTCASLVLQLQAETIFGSDSSGPITKKITSFPHSTERSVADSPGCATSRPGVSVATVIQPTIEGALQVTGFQRPVNRATLLCGMRFHAEVVCSWRKRKAPQSSGTHFELRTAI